MSHRSAGSAAVPVNLYTGLAALPVNLGVPQNPGAAEPLRTQNAHVDQHCRSSGLTDTAAESLYGFCGSVGQPRGATEPGMPQNLYAVEPVCRCIGLF